MATPIPQLLQLPAGQRPTHGESGKGSLGGGGINILGGNANITGTTFGGVGLTHFNQSVTSGGGLAYDGRFHHERSRRHFDADKLKFIDNIAINHGGGLTMSNSNFGFDTMDSAGFHR